MPTKQPLSTSDKFDLVSTFPGYRNKEDITNLPPGYLVTGSRDVLVTTGGRVGSRNGYSLDGQSDSTIASIDSAYDYAMHNGQDRHLRAGNDKLQVRYVASAGDKYKTNTFTDGQVYWIDLMGSATTPIATAINFTDWWDNTELQSRLLFVNGGSTVYEWSGGMATIASTTANTIIKSGTTSFVEEGFYNINSTPWTVLVNGNEYVYTGGASTKTLTGVTPNPTGEADNSVIMQKPFTVTNASMTSMPNINNDLIGTLKGQLYLGSLTNNSVYISKVNNYKNYAFTSPVRLVGEGAIITLDNPPIGFISQEQDMYITAGKNDWYLTNFTLSADLSGEALKILKLKTGAQQASLSQAFINKIKNSIVFVSNEPTLDELGRVEQILGTPQQKNISDPIKNDFDAYDFTDGQVFYHKYFIYVSVPKEGLIRIFNLAKGFWEAPQYIPVGKFSIIDGDLYGHSYNTPETFKLFDGLNDNGHQINSIAKFSYQNYGQRAKTKYFNEFYTEGYINPNTTLTLGIKYEIDGCATTTNYDITGTDSQIVCLSSSNSSLGKESLGKHPLGGETEFVLSTALPPKFRVIKTFPRKDFFEAQYSYSSLGIDMKWEILAMGAKVSNSMFNESEIKQ